MVAAVGAGAYLAYRAFLGHEDRVTASYSPPNAYAYIAINTDRTSQAWLDAWQLARSAGFEDDLLELPDRIALEEGEDPTLWNDVIKPAIGDEIGFVAWPADAGAADTPVEPNFAAIVMFSERAKADQLVAEVLERQDGVPHEVTYRDITFQVGDDEQAAGILDDALIFASSQSAFEAIVDARRDGALDSVDGFSAAAGRAADDPLLFVWVDGTSIAADAEELFAAGMPLTGSQEEMQSGSLSLTGLGLPLPEDAAMGTLTVTLKAEDQALRLSILSDDRPSFFSDANTVDAFSADMPASTLFYLASNDMYSTIWQPMFEQLEALEAAAATDPMLSANPFGMMFSPDMFNSMLGFDVEAGLLAHLRGPFALGFSGHVAGDSFGGEFNLISDVDDPAAVLQSVGQLADTLAEQGMPVERDDTGFRVDMSGFAVRVEVRDDALRISGSGGAPADGDVAGGGRLADDETYRRAMDTLPEDASWVGYIAIGRALSLVPADQLPSDADAELQSALDALEALVFASSASDDGTRTDMLLLFRER
jgi:hypothetical protein